MRILLVDDDASTRLICRRVLQRLAKESIVEEAADGAAALEKLRGGAYDGILCDYRMGAVSGLDVLAAAGEAQPSAFRALMTGFADPTLVAKAHERASVHAFIEKPMTSREFEAVLQRDFLDPLRQARRPEG